MLTVGMSDGNGCAAAIGCAPTLQEVPYISALQGKSAALVLELMFTRSMFATPDMFEQGNTLARMASLVDDGTVQPTETKRLGGLSVETLKAAHEIIEAGSMIGRLVMEH